MNHSSAMKPDGACPFCGQQLVWSFKRGLNMGQRIKLYHSHVRDEHPDMWYRI